MLKIKKKLRGIKEQSKETLIGLFSPPWVHYKKKKHNIGQSRKAKQLAILK